MKTKRRRDRGAAVDQGASAESHPMLQTVARSGGRTRVDRTLLSPGCNRLSGPAHSRVFVTVQASWSRSRMTADPVNVTDRVAVDDR